MEDDLRELWRVMGNYRLITYKIAHYRQEVFQIETNEGRKALKICNYPEEKILFIYSIMNHLWQKGFHKISPFILTLTGEPFVLRKDKIYVLNDWIPGKQCDFASLEDLKGAAATLAEFHKYSFGFEFPSQSKSRVMTHKWITTITKRCEDLRTFANLASTQTTPLGEKYLLHKEAIIETAERAKEMLADSRYPYIASEAIVKRFFIHRDVAGRNFIMHKKGAWLIDFDYARYDIRVVDIVRILERGLKSYRWNKDVGKSIIAAYNHKNPLLQEEYPVILALMCWPQKTWRLLDRYYNGKRQLQEEVFSRKFSRLMSDMKYQADFLNWFKKEYCR